jgi:hypothetical protein
VSTKKKKKKKKAMAVEMPIFQVLTQEPSAFILFFFFTGWMS